MNNEIRSDRFDNRSGNDLRNAGGVRQEGGDRREGGESRENHTERHQDGGGSHGDRR
ncbi:MAG: hypothetical protein NTZ08_07050 [Verrucomicrobia bacterium]|nr:hypothetical protein [Verrucomicrobiota bacterium]